MVVTMFRSTEPAEAGGAGGTRQSVLGRVSVIWVPCLG